MSSDITKISIFIDDLVETYNKLNIKNYSDNVVIRNDKVKEFLRESILEKIKTEKTHLKNLVNLEDLDNDR